MSATQERIRSRVARVALAARGLRFGEHLRRAKELQRLDADELWMHQVGELRRVLAAALSGTPSFAARLPVSGDRVASIGIDMSVWSSMPPSTRDDLRLVHAELSHKRRLPLSVVEKRTSGSSGSPLRIYKQSDGLARELAATWRSYGWLGLEFGERSVRVWGRPLDGRRRAIGLVKNWLTNVEPISAFDVDESRLRERLARIAAVKPRYIYGYASAVRELAEAARRAGFKPPASLAAVITTAEPLDERSRALINDAFGVACRDEYGASEVGSIAHECPAGAMHVMADNLLVEVLGTDGTVRTDGFGELLVTDLTNLITPVVRFRLGDYGVLDANARCECGVRFPMLREVRGRVEDTVVTPDGLRHHPAKVCYAVDKALSTLSTLRRYQVTQTHPDRMEVRLVLSANGPGESPSPGVGEALQAAFRETIHPGLEVHTVLVDDIPREASGKYRLVRSLVGHS